ncbi:NUDIX domain-containing protein [Parachryseolinea silvisoli]|jgi:8-oxo-dGTP diphosphatase|uniref:NUDIX domain-containing protein n=1 Tax=Parachryseolinea silvisoli TaxID=2873601 RepID=UPI00226586A8|nr:NUDIX domain-containing protein [Parachryseolinea silvisoli]MCD9014653.1 NUDIX domain-containing protein [Parachryseolinea silvisoli]
MTPREQKILPAVSAAIFNDQGHVLLQQRRDTGKWCIISGHVEFGETVEDAMLREIREEINTAAEIIRLIGVYSMPAFATYDHTDHRVQYITSYFEVKLLEAPDISFTNAETRAWRFFSPDALPADLDQVNPYWLADALNKQSVFIR